jgi:glycosyltransferase involved in cell wall biosynthesis
VCTCDRPDTLRALLEALAEQPPISQMAVLVLDNGATPVREVVAPFSDRLDLHYERVAVAGLTPVRNRAIELARELGGRYLAFIDDDELPHPGWLRALLERAEDSGADVVSGPVLPEYSEPPPAWIEEGDFFRSPGDNVGSGNVLLKLSALPRDAAACFRVEFSETGGEDYDLFRRLREGGARFATAEDAIVVERIPPQRTRLAYLLRLSLRDGARDAQMILLTGGAWPRILLALAGRVVAKVLYATSHIALALVAAATGSGVRWRAACALRDLAAATGCLLRLAGVRFRFYGRDSRS